MKKDLGDHIGKKRGWLLFEIAELIKLAFNNLPAIKELFKKK